MRHQPSPSPRLRGALVALLALASPAIPPIALVATATNAEANADHPLWKTFIGWLANKKRTPQEELVYRHILGGQPRFNPFQPFAHSMQEQVETMFRQWLDQVHRARVAPTLGSEPPRDGAR